jgi:hypothetical protein
MTKHAFRTRRAMIVRRWTAYRVGRAQRAIWAKKRATFEDVEENEEVVGVREDLAELPDDLLG